MININQKIKDHNKEMLLLKCVVDTIVSIFLIVLVSPILLIFTLLIKVLTGGPVLFLQDRIGYKGRVFKIYKFTTMVKNAQKTDECLAKHNGKSSKLCARSPDDPRITKIGRFMRKYSIDELPQLFNVLKGDMSLVGPRPYPVYEFEKLTDFEKKIKTTMKPGLTCILQINGRTTITDYSERIKMDLEYVNNWSFWLDLKLLFKTIPIVLSGKGAS